MSKPLKHVSDNNGVNWCTNKMNPVHSRCNVRETENIGPIYHASTRSHSFLTKITIARIYSKAQICHLNIFPFSFDLRCVFKCASR